MIEFKEIHEFTNQIAEKIFDEIKPIIEENLNSIKGFNKHETIQIKDIILAAMAMNFILALLKKYEINDQKNILNKIFQSLVKRIETEGNDND